MRFMIIVSRPSRVNVVPNSLLARRDEEQPPLRGPRRSVWSIEDDREDGPALPLEQSGGPHAWLAPPKLTVVVRVVALVSKPQHLFLGLKVLCGGLATAGHIIQGLVDVFRNITNRLRPGGTKGAKTPTR